MNRPLESRLDSLPRDPGVYLFRGRDGAVLYIGKAKSLRSRVRSYFQAGREGRVGMSQLVSRVEDVETIVTGTEAEALHLEQNLIKRHRPPFNVRLRDDKSFPYIAVTVEDEYPRVMFTRERHRRGVVCLAPCVGYVSREDYRAIVDQVIEFLSGETRPILRRLEEKMREAAAAERFEEAARYRNRLFSVQHLAERQAGGKRAVGAIEVLGPPGEGDR